MGHRWTLRGVDPEAVAQVQEISSTSGQTLGELVTEAIRVWYASLPEETEDPELADLQKRFAEYQVLFEQLCGALQTSLDHNRAS